MLLMLSLRVEGPSCLIFLTWVLLSSCQEVSEKKEYVGEVLQEPVFHQKFLTHQRVTFTQDVMSQFDCLSLGLSSPPYIGYIVADGMI